MAGTGGGSSSDAMAPCLRCRQALESGASPNDPNICQASRNTYTALRNCVCMSGSACSPPCGPHCMDPSANPFTQTCQNCLLTTCPNVVNACFADA